MLHFCPPQWALIRTELSWPKLFGTLMPWQGKNCTYSHHHMYEWFQFGLDCTSGNSHLQALCGPIGLFRISHNNVGCGRANRARKVNTLRWTFWSCPLLGAIALHLKHYFGRAFSGAFWVRHCTTYEPCVVGGESMIIIGVH